MDDQGTPEQVSDQRPGIYVDSRLFCEENIVIFPVINEYLWYNDRLISVYALCFIVRMI